MRLENGDTSYPSICGALLSNISFWLILMFAIPKFEVLFRIKDVDILETVRESYFQFDEELTAERDEFFIAAALTNYDSDPEITEKAEYGELKIEHYGWGNEDLGYTYGTTPLKNRQCTDEDLGFTNGPDTFIYPFYEGQLPEIMTYRKKFKCIDKNELRIWGDFDQPQAMQLAISFHMCQGKKKCKSEEEIKNWLAGKYIVILYNQVRFKTDKLGSSALIKEARIKYIPVSS